MRTTLDIDDDILATAREIAQAEGRSIGHVMSALARQALTTPDTSGFGESTMAFDTNTWPTLPNRQGLLVTTALVEQIIDEIDREDAAPMMQGPVGSPQPAPKPPARR
jgi:hypothetical protein